MNHAWAYVPKKSSGSDVIPSDVGTVASDTKADGSTGDVFTFTGPGSISISGKPQTQSVAGYFSPNELADYNVLLSVGNNGDNDIALEMNEDGTASLRTKGSSPTTIATSTGDPIFAANQWHHIALTVDGSGNAKGYVNGQVVVQGTHASVPDVGIRIGITLFGCGAGSVPFKGFKVYEVNAYDTLLTVTQVQALNAGWLVLCYLNM